MRMENRKRNVQVKFRLTSEESAVLNRDVNNSGMTKNEYFIQSLIAKATMPVLSWVKKYWGDDIDITCNLGNQMVGFARCSYVKGLEQVEIHSLFVSKLYRQSELMQKLLDEVFVFTEEKKAETIKVCCGAEPYTKDGYISLEQEMSFYNQNGFERKQDTFGSIPCMVKVIKQGGAEFEY